MSQWTPHILRLEQQYHLPPGLLGAMMRAESGGDPNARSPVGAIGLMQLMPGTAAGLGVDPYNPVQNLEGGAKYIRQQLDRFGNNVQYAIAAYNAGPGAVQKYGGIPPYAETKQYVNRVTGYWQESSRYGQPTQSSSPATPRPTQRPVPSVYEIDPARIAKIQHAWTDAPENGGLRVQREYTKAANSAAEAARIEGLNARDQQAWQAQQTTTTPTTTSSGNPYTANAGSRWYKTPTGWVERQRNGEAGWQFLQRLGHGFGLENDPGTNQTYGGQHAPNSHHYANNAIDYGDARNNWDALNAWYKYLNQNRQALGIVELLNEGDHIHAAIGG